MAGKFVTWLGEDQLHYVEMENEQGVIERNPAPGPSFMFWDRVRFDKGEPVLIDPDQAGIPPTLKATFTHILAKASQNAFFKVEDIVDNDEGEDAGDGEHDEHHKRKQPRLQPVPKRKR